ncbi:MAG TPA: transglycosylase SLT domain-containing protein [Ktedonobacteraceae bacterium]
MFFWNANNDNGCPGGCCFGCLFAVLIAGIFLLVFLAWLSQPARNNTSGNVIVAEAMSIAHHLHPGPPHGYDVSYDASIPQAALAYWQAMCPGCSTWQNGNLQCATFVAAATALAGAPLDRIQTAVQWWSVYKTAHGGWSEIPNGSAMPQPGDVIVFSSSTNAAGHVGIVTNVDAHTLTFAEANGPGPFVTFHMQENTPVITWPGFRVLGYLRYTSSETLPRAKGGLPANLPSSVYISLAAQDAQQAGIPVRLFVAQINQESGFNPNAVSPAGAEGIAQFMPDTAQGLGIDPWNPQQALQAAAHLMANYDHLYDDYAMALASYNAGSGAVNDALLLSTRVSGSTANWLQFMPLETQQYVSTIMHA